MAGLGFLVGAFAFEFTFRAVYDRTIPGVPDSGQLSVFAFSYFSLTSRSYFKMFSDFEFTCVGILSYMLLITLGYCVAIICGRRLLLATIIIFSVLLAGLVLRRDYVGAWLPIYLIDRADYDSTGVLIFSIFLMTIGGIAGTFQCRFSNSKKRGFEVIPQSLEQP